MAANSLFDQIKQIKKGNADYYARLPLEERKKVVPFLLLKWLSCSSNPTFLKLLDSYANQYVFSLHSHPELLWKTMATVGTVLTPGDRIQWIYPKAKKGYKDSVNVVKTYFGCTEDEARAIIDTEGKDNVLKMAEVLGYQDSELKAIQKEFKK